jgi:hypothetical protein
MKCRVGERTGDFVAPNGRRDKSREGDETSFFVTEHTAKRVQRRDEV